MTTPSERARLRIKIHIAIFVVALLMFLYFIWKPLILLFIAFVYGVISYAEAQENRELREAEERERMGRFYQLSPRDSPELMLALFLMDCEPKHRFVVHKKALKHFPFNEYELKFWTTDDNDCYNVALVERTNGH